MLLFHFAPLPGPAGVYNVFITAAILHSAGSVTFQTFIQFAVLQVNLAGYGLIYILYLVTVTLCLYLRILNIFLC